MHKRRHGRVRAKGVASHLRDGAQLITGLTVENLSRGGAFIRTATPMKVGLPVVLDLVRPGLKRSLQLTGRVVSTVTPEEAKERRAIPGMGIQFDPYSPTIGERLTELLQALGASPAVLEADPAGSEAPAAPVAAPSTAAVAVPESARLMVQVTGLLMELGDWQQKVAGLEKENASLRAEVERLNAWIQGAGLKPAR